jgi:hypothetical protein
MDSSTLADASRTFHEVGHIALVSGRPIAHPNVRNGASRACSILTLRLELSAGVVTPAAPSARSCVPLAAPNSSSFPEVPLRGRPRPRIRLSVVSHLTLCKRRELIDPP